MEPAVAQAKTVGELVAPYRKYIVEVKSAVVRPSTARRESGLRRAIAFIREHLEDALTLSEVAHVAGFAPGYFSKLFKRSEGTTWERYLLQLRLERAAELLKSAPQLTVDRVRQLSGFRNRAYFNRAFRAAMGAAPSDYRRAVTSMLRRRAGHQWRQLPDTLALS
jgi:two-component system, response regulator YesN